MPRTNSPIAAPLLMPPRLFVQVARSRWLAFRRGTLWDSDSESGDALGLAAVLTRPSIPDGPITLDEAMSWLGLGDDATVCGLISGFDGRPLAPGRSADHAIAWGRGMAIAKAANLAEPACGWPMCRRNEVPAEGGAVPSSGLDPLNGPGAGVVAGIGKYFGKGRGR